MWQGCHYIKPDAQAQGIQGGKYYGSTAQFNSDER